MTLLLHLPAGLQHAPNPLPEHVSCTSGPHRPSVLAASPGVCVWVGWAGVEEDDDVDDDDDDGVGGADGEADGAVDGADEMEKVPEGKVSLGRQDGKGGAQNQR